MNLKVANFEYAGFQYEIVLDEAGNLLAIPETGQPAAAHKEKHGAVAAYKSARRRSTRRLGTVIVFRPEVSEAQAKATVDLLIEKGVVDTELSHPRVEKFDPTMGGPVWYVP